MDARWFSQAGSPTLLGVLYARQEQEYLQGLLDQRRQSIKHCQEAIDLGSREPGLYTRLANTYIEVRDWQAAFATLRQGIDCSAGPRHIYQCYVDRLREFNRTGEAIAVAQEALRRFPDDFGMRLREALSLPLVYQTLEDLASYRRRFSTGLAALGDNVPLERFAECRRALEGLLGFANFYLAYQCHDDVELQRAFGQLVRRVAAANFPEWTHAVSVPHRHGRLRIGYVSAHFFGHSVTKMYLRLLQEHDKDQFEVHAYHLGKMTDDTTEEVRRACTKFSHVPNDLEGGARAIRADNLHLLVYLDIGMNPIATLLAALRLAPVQCVGWGHPVTSGLPTVDYFLSSACMEPVDGQDHYTEQLVRLPGPGMCYQRPLIPWAVLSKTRGDYSLRQDAVVYLACQSVFKYLPQHDDVFASIAKRVPQSQFAFVVMNEGVLESFRERLHRSFSAAGLSVGDYCVFLLTQDPFSYWNLNLLADVYLDTIEWSGGNTTLEAIACGLPIVTLPGRFMRGRHSYAFLTQLGVCDTIARDKQDYVDIAVRLAEDDCWRASVVERLKVGSRRFYEDTTSLTALEDFFRRVVTEQ